MNPPLLFLLTCSLKSKFLEWISRSNSRSWLTCFLQAKEAQAKPEAILARFKGRLQICPKGLSIQCWAVEYYFTFASQKPEGHYAHLMLYIKAVTQMEDNQPCSRPTVLQKCLNKCHVLLSLRRSSLLWQQAAGEPPTLRCCSNSNSDRLVLWGGSLVCFLMALLGAIKNKSWL